MFLAVQSLIIFFMIVGENDKDERADNFDDIKSGAADESQAAVGSFIPLQGFVPECTTNKICPTAVIW